MEREGGKVDGNRFAAMKAEIDVAHDIVRTTRAPKGGREEKSAARSGENMLACVREEQETGSGRGQASKARTRTTRRGRDGDALSFAHDLPPCSPQSSSDLLPCDIVIVGQSRPGRDSICHAMRGLSRASGGYSGTSRIKEPGLRECAMHWGPPF